MALVALCAAATAMAQGAQADPFVDSWPDRDVAGKAAAMTYGRFSDPLLTHDRVIETLTKAGCAREDGKTFIKFTCATNPRVTFLTQPDASAHPSISLVADVGSRGQLRARKTALLAGTAPVEREVAAAVVRVWADSLPWPADLVPQTLAPLLAGLPVVENDLTGGDTSSAYEVVMRELNASGCTRRQKGEYLVFACVRSLVMIVMTSPSAKAHPAFALAIPDPNTTPKYAKLRMMFSRGSAQGPTGESDEGAIWIRGVNDLVIAEVK